MNAIARAAANSASPIIGHQASVVNQKFVALRCLGLSIVSAEAFDGSEDVVGRLGSFEWLRGGIVMTDEVHDVCTQRLDTAIDAAPDLFVGDECEEALDLMSQDDLVGVRWTCQRGGLASCLIAPGYSNEAGIASPFR